MKRTGVFLIILFGIIILVLFFAFSCNKKNKTKNVDCSKINATYNADVKPIISGNCNSPGCHQVGSINGDFTSYAGLKSKVDNGTLNSRVVQQKNMPPSNTLSTDNINKVNCWIQSGAPNN